jgi:hypothetical protein
MWDVNDEHIVHREVVRSIYLAYRLFARTEASEAITRPGFRARRLPFRLITLQ